MCGEGLIETPVVISGGERIHRKLYFPVEKFNASPSKSKNALCTVLKKGAVDRVECEAYDMQWSSQHGKLALPPRSRIPQWGYVMQIPVARGARAQKEPRDKERHVSNGNTFWLLKVFVTPRALCAESR